MMLAVVLAAAWTLAAPRYPLRTADRLVSSALMNKLGIRGKKHRGALPQSTGMVEAGTHEGLRVKVVYGLDDDSKQCPQMGLSEKLKSSTGDSKGLGTRQCTEGTVPIDTYEGLKCAVWHSQGLDHHEAQQTCSEMEGHLVALATPEIETKLKEHLRSKTTNDTFWSGVQILDPTTTPLKVAFYGDATVTVWNERWNAPSFSVTGKPCCPNLKNETGNPRCLVYDGWRDLRGLHPFPITDCSQRHAFFCEVAPITIDQTTGEQLKFTTTSPHVLYSPQPPHVATFFNRETAQPYNTNCTADMIVTKPMLNLLKAELANALKFISMTLSPIFRSTGLTGNGRAPYEFLCKSDYFSWDLKEMMDTSSGQYLLHGTDMLVFVTTMPDPYATAWSIPCGFSTDQRPNVIVLNVAPSHLAIVSQRKHGRQKLRIRILQSLLQSLGLHENLFHSWKQPVVNRTISSKSCSQTINTSCRKLAVIVTPAVKTWINTHQFLCSGNPAGGSGTIEGAELEDANISPGPPDIVLGLWEKRIYRGEVMTMLPPLTEDFSDELQVVSGLTLAAFEDMGWYRVNKDMGAELRWGKGQPCKFATDDCTDWPARYKCDGSVTHTNLACSTDFTSLGFCNKATWPAGAIPSKFVWVSGQPLLGGSDPLMDWCFFKEEAPVAHTSCLWDSPELPDCQGEPCTVFSVRGASSRCFETTLRYKQYTTTSTPTARGTCLPNECVLVGSRWMLNIFIGGTTYTCTYKYEVVGPSHASAFGLRTAADHTLLGEITCPDPQEMCNEVFTLQKACDPVDDCSAGGFCRDGSCVCLNSRDHPGPNPALPHVGSRGFFQGENCQMCEDGYFGYPACKSKKCVVDPTSQVMCYGNGVCDGVTGLCRCFQNATHGYWDPSTHCRVCQSGFTGGSCTKQACSSSRDCGKGSCNLGTGRCRCFTSKLDGYWGGERCDRCRDGYDISTHCAHRIRSYFACDTLQQADILIKEPDPINCTACNIQCGAEGKLSRCATPQRIQETDEFGCLLTPKIPKCADQAVYCAPCPVPAAEFMDCNGYPLLYTTCWVKDVCGCSPPFIACMPGTSAAPPDSYEPQTYNAQGLEDTRPQYTTAPGEPTCECKVTIPAEIDCWGSKSLDGKAPSYASGMVVYFDPRKYQIIDEDFCHCTSPPVPTCSDTTKPYLLKERSYGTTLDCVQMKRATGCPDWEKILNVDQKYNSSGPDLSVIDCGNWPSPRFRTSKDHCGCPLPVFKCKDGSRGVCDTSTCPVWERKELDCKGLQPPVTTLRGKHPCGCLPPPKPICREGTGPCCECDYSVGVKTVWVDCKGMSLEPLDWDSEDVYPFGNPRVQPCDPCPQCPHTPPVRKCIPGYSVRPASENRISNCKTPLSLESCPVYPPSCPVDCKGAPPPTPIPDDECECPQPQPPPCLPGTYGPGSIDDDITAAPCSSDATMCGAYACAPGYDLSTVASKLGYSASSFRRCQVKEDVWDAMSSVKYCKQSCMTDLDCACGFKCSVCGLCLYHLVPDPAVENNCLLDPGLCGLYGCEYSCADDIERIKEDLILDAVCKMQCTTDSDCHSSAVCTKPVYSPPPGAGAAFSGEVKVVGKAEPSSASSQHTQGIPGFNVRATRVAVKLADEQHEFVSERDSGECVASAAERHMDVMYCYSHDDCNGYACGRTATQTFFSASICRSSCWVNAHCHPSYKCSRATATCIRGSSTKKTCEDDPDGRLRVYGGCEGLLEGNVTCDTDLSVVYGLPQPSFVKYMCPMTCESCVEQAQASQRTAQVLESCVDDIDGKLVAYGASAIQRCAAVITVLTCNGDVGSFVTSVQPGVTVRDLCPNSCGACTPVVIDPVDSLFGNLTFPDPCDSYNASVCKSSPGCCFIPEKAMCSSCNIFEANPTERVAESSRVLPDTPSCDMQPFEFCHPYVCGGLRGAVPAIGSQCPVSCVNDEGCQPFFRCKKYTLEDLAVKYGVSLVPNIDRTTGVASSKPLYNNFQMQLLSAASDDHGVCVPTPYVREDTQQAASLSEQRNTNLFQKSPKEYPWAGKDLPVLRVPVAHLKGFQVDPYVVMFQHAPFMPPPLTRPKPIGTVFTSPAECYPYIAVAKGITNDQLGSFGQRYPSCKTSCFDDGDCAGGLVCSVVSRKRVFVSSSGTRVVADQDCDNYDDCLGDQKNSEGVQTAVDKGSCQPPRGLGVACTDDNQCGSKHCVEGLCCNSRCDIPCQTCSELGICGWVLPFTDPHRRCSRCEWCDYEPDENGEMSPFSPLSCAAIPKGKDPKDMCGVRGVCNGEGSCLVLPHNWGGSGSETCALGFSGPDCTDSMVAYRQIRLKEQQKACSASESAYLSRSPFTGSYETLHDYVTQRTPDGFTPMGVKQPASRSTKVVDLRPRQWVSRVLGLKDHSAFKCSNILYKPSSDRVHGVSMSSWAPKQYYKADGRDVNPALKWYPYVNCLAPDVDSCNAKWGCRWDVLGSFCIAKTDARTVSEAEEQCMMQYGCFPNNATVGLCEELRPKCAVYTNGEVDWSRITPPPLQWIELSVDIPVYVESIVLYENNAPGSLVRVEIQEALSGSAAMASAGGGNVETDLEGNVVPPRKPNITRTQPKITTAKAEHCATFTEHGPYLCKRQIGCDWNVHSASCVAGSRCKVNLAECTLLEQKRECYWDPIEGLCMDGVPCTPSSTEDTITPKLVQYCNDLNNSACLSEPTTCVWGLKTQDTCNHWSFTDECKPFTTFGDCNAQVRGLSTGLVSYCNWNPVNKTCTEKGELYDCTLKQNGELRTEVECNVTRACVWDQTDRLCVVNMTDNNSTHFDCSVYAHRSDCIACPFNSESKYCNAQCSWHMTEVQSCLAILPGECGIFDYNECLTKPVCKWRGKTPTIDVTSRRQASALEVPQSTLQGANFSVIITQACYLNIEVAPSTAGTVSTNSDYKTFCEGIFDKQLCNGAIMWTTGEPFICVWKEGIVMDDNTIIPAAPLSRYELAAWGAAEYPRLFRARDSGPTYLGQQPTKAEVGGAPGDVPCEDLPPGKSLNVNTNPWTTVWNRQNANFPLRKKYRETTIDVGQTGFRARNIKLWFAPTSSDLSQVDAVAVVGRNDIHKKCKGLLWASPIRDGTPTSSTIQSGSVWAVACSGRGICTPTGCKCLGNFYGDGCEGCAFGWSGTACNKKLLVGCRVVASEDLSQFSDADEVQKRWAIRNYHLFTSRAVSYKHFGTSLTSPVYDLGDRTHFRIGVGVLLVDVPKSDGDCGIRVMAAVDKAGTHKQMMHAQPCKLFVYLFVITTNTVLLAST